MKVAAELSLGQSHLAWALILQMFAMSCIGVHLLKESGRVGRDGEPAYAKLFYTDTDFSGGVSSGKKK